MDEADQNTGQENESRILIVDDEPLLVSAIKRVLRGEGLELLSAETGPEALALLEKNLIDVMLLDVILPGLNGLEVLRQAKRIDPDVVIIIMTGHGTIQTAVEAMKEGAFDFLTKPFPDNDLIPLTVERALQYRQLRQENRKLSGMVSGTVEYPNIIGPSAAMQRILRLLPRLAAIDSTTLIAGESGTGKEVVARAIHFNGPRRKNPFVPVDCGSIPEGIIESELFGHAKGSFTGASQSSGGLIKMADKGTLFLDEIGELPMSMQTRLLRFLQEKEVRPVGETASSKVDVRIIAATNRDLKVMVEQKKFREDLYYRLNVVNIEIPPLRQRKEDIPSLLRFFLDNHGRRLNTKITLSPEAFQRLINYSWPGNARELENIVIQILSLYPGEFIAAENLPSFITPRGAGLGQDAVPPKADLPGDIPLSLPAYEKLAVERALSYCQGNVLKAAELLGVGKSTLYRKIADLKIDVKTLKE